MNNDLKTIIVWLPISYIINYKVSNIFFYYWPLELFPIATAISKSILTSGYLLTNIGIKKRVIAFKVKIGK